MMRTVLNFEVMIAIQMRIQGDKLRDTGGFVAAEEGEFESWILPVHHVLTA